MPSGKIMAEERQTRGVPLEFLAHEERMGNTLTGLGELLERRERMERIAARQADEYRSRV